jgi:hypothetical protein
MQLHRPLLSGASFGSRIEKLSWIGVGTDIRHTPALTDHFMRGNLGIAPIRI